MKQESTSAEDFRAGRLPRPRPLIAAAKVIAEAMQATFGSRAVKSTGRVEIEVPVRIVSTPNLREHHIAAWRRAVKQDEAVTYLLLGLPGMRDLVKAGPPYVVTLTVIGRVLKDDDNNVAGCKAARDSIARLLGVNDGDRSKVRWIYPEQEIGKYALRIEIRGGELEAK